MTAWPCCSSFPRLVTLQTGMFSSQNLLLQSESSFATPFLAGYYYPNQRLSHVLTRQSPPILFPFTRTFLDDSGPCYICCSRLKPRRLDGIPLYFIWLITILLSVHRSQPQADLQEALVAAVPALCEATLQQDRSAAVAQTLLSLVAGSQVSACQQSPSHTNMSSINLPLPPCCGLIFISKA